MSSRLIVVSPVKFPPGRARLATSPITTGSLTVGKTTGSVVPVRFMARHEGVSVARMRSNGSRTSSAASPSSVAFPAPSHRYSIAMSLPSTSPCSRSPSMNALRSPAFPVSVPADR